MEISMYKATRKLIQERQQYSTYVIEKVDVRNVGGGVSNACFDNSFNAIDRSKGIGVVSGWIVGSFNKSKNSTEIVQHFWNADRAGNHFDTTPLGGDDVEYVIDVDISHYGQQHYDKIKSCVAASLLLKNDKFIAVKFDEDRLRFRDIRSLATEELFETI